MRHLVLVERPQARRVERGQQRDDLLGVEVVERGRGGRRAGRDVARLGLRLESRARPDARAIAQELLELLLVAVRLSAARVADDRLEALVLGEPLDGLAGRVAVAVAGRLEAAVVGAPAEAHLGPGPGPPAGAGPPGGPPRG